ncbi:MAG: DNA repair protein RecO [Acidimicrobiia bacterium]|nr:DNA repair protein RecO [Acidimicrobiia bacterium]NNF09862.1 DNA repair protein RecO [Acidimicrobiia bacterium]NNL70837.1 DNA repair protein RecO [Acidimicrobiia bacterium]
MALRQDQGIVLRGYPFGEADKVVVLLSPNHGKVRAVAKGVRKTKSRFGGRLEPFTHVDVLLYEGRNLDTITQVSVVEAYSHLRLDLDRVLAAGTMVEAIDAVSQEGAGSHRQFLLLQRGLRALEAGPVHPDLVAAFLLKLAAVVGVAPALETCAECGSDRDLLRFSLASGGVVCSRCSPERGVKLRVGLTEHLARLASSELGDLPPAGDLSRDAIGLTRRFVEYHLEQRLESLSLIDG